MTATHQLHFFQPVQFNPEAPIGIFDSGAGGLTIAKAVRDRLPFESFIYIADTLHLPYGEKTMEQIQGYTLAITNYLYQQNCKLIVIACNTASSLGIEFIQKEFPNVAILDVISPVVDYVAAHYRGTVLGLIGTRKTVTSQIYEKRLAEKNTGIQLHSLATPELATYIESDLSKTIHLQNLLKKYLNDPRFQSINGLILACTHYPLIQKEIEAFFKKQIPIIDSPALVAKTVHEDLKKRYALTQRSNTVLSTFYTTKNSPLLSKLVNLFFKTNVRLIQL